MLSQEPLEGQIRLAEDLDSLKRSFAHPVGNPVEARYFAVLRLGHLIESYSYPLTISSGLEILGEWFFLSSNLLKSLILRCLDDLKAQLRTISVTGNKLDTDTTLTIVAQSDRTVRHVLRVFATNDSLAKSLALQFLGKIAVLVSARVDVFHAVLQNLDLKSKSEIEFAAAATALDNILTVSANNVSDLALSAVETGLKEAVNRGRMMLAAQVLPVLVQLCSTRRSREVVITTLTELFHKIKAENSSFAASCLTILTRVCLQKVHLVPAHAQFLLNLVETHSGESLVHFAALENLQLLSSRSYGFTPAVRERLLGHLLSADAPSMLKSAYILKILFNFGFDDDRDKLDQICSKCDVYACDLATPKLLRSVAILFLQKFDPQRLCQFRDLWMSSLELACLSGKRELARAELNSLAKLVSLENLDWKAVILSCSEPLTLEVVLKGIGRLVASGKLELPSIVAALPDCAKEVKAADDRAVCLSLTLIMRHERNAFLQSGPRWIASVAETASDLWSLYLLGVELCCEGLADESLPIWARLKDAVGRPDTSAHILSMEQYAMSARALKQSEHWQAEQHLFGCVQLERQKLQCLASGYDGLLRYLSALYAVAESVALGTGSDLDAERADTVLCDLARLLLEVPGQSMKERYSIIELLRRVSDALAPALQSGGSFSLERWVSSEEYAHFARLPSSASGRTLNLYASIPRFLLRLSRAPLSLRLNFKPGWNANVDDRGLMAVNGGVQQTLRVEGLVASLYQQPTFARVTIVVALVLGGLQSASATFIEAMALQQARSGLFLTEETECCEGLVFTKGTCTVQDDYFSTVFLLSFAWVPANSHVDVLMYAFLHGSDGRIYKPPSSTVKVSALVC